MGVVSSQYLRKLVYTVAQKSKPLSRIIIKSCYKPPVQLVLINFEYKMSTKM